MRRNPIVKIHPKATRGYPKLHGGLWDSDDGAMNEVQNFSVGFTSLREASMELLAANVGRAKEPGQ